MRAICLGGADCLWSDVLGSERILGTRWWDIVVACNDAGRDWPHRLDHWVSLHPEKLLKVWTPERPGGYETWSDPNRQRGPAPTDHHLDNWGGSSGLFCVQVALEVGASYVVACGMPMDARPHYFGTKEWGPWEQYRDAWDRHADEMGVVRSMSGWTAELLGRPDEQWARQFA